MAGPSPGKPGYPWPGQSLLRSLGAGETEAAGRVQVLRSPALGQLGEPGPAHTSSGTNPGLPGTHLRPECPHAFRVCCPVLLFSCKLLSQGTTSLSDSCYIRQRKLCEKERSRESDQIGPCMETESVRDARRLNICEINQMQTRINTKNDEIKSLKKTIISLKKVNEALGKKQEELEKQHEKLVLSLNQTMQEKSKAIIYINDTCTRISSEREDTEVQRKHVQETEEQIAKQIAEYLLRKQQLTTQTDEFKKICELARTETYKKKEELGKLKNRMTNMKQTVTISTVLAEKLHKVNLENKELQEKMNANLQQYRIVLTEEDQVFLQKRKLYDANQGELAFIAQKENFLAQRQIDIKNMEEGLVTLEDLHKTESPEIGLAGAHAVPVAHPGFCVNRWAALPMSILHLEKTKLREMEIDEFVIQIEKVTAQLKEEEEFVIREKNLIYELSIYEDLIVKEMKISKGTEDELIDSLPHLHLAEEEYTIKNRSLQELYGTLKGTPEASGS
ncbi:hypothetical protein GW7_21066 [Heterocephalus glaber]|uniref:Uncharacterized protein n=1 Tax=Heterocephalus glaber TaxID=10181 RepID=G5C5H0_HETGA|nr:hypothetical protein GW7_21066 [Heterocephalus glaber]